MCVLTVSGRLGMIPLRALFKDNRLLMHLCQTEAAVDDEFERIKNISVPVWNCFARVCGNGESGASVLDHTMRASVMTRLYLKQFIFDPAHAPFFELTQGDILSNLRHVRDNPACGERNISQVRELMADPVNEPGLLDLMGLVKTAPFDANVAEQDHAGGSRQKSMHPRFGKKSITRRALMVTMAPLLRTPPVDSKLAKYQKQLAKVRRKCPAKTSGKSMLVQALVAKSNDDHCIALPRDRNAHQQLTIGTSGDVWRDLDDQTRLDCEILSKDHVLRGEKRKLDSLFVARSTAEAREAVLEQQQRDFGVMCRSSSCRLGDRSRSRFMLLYKDARFQGASLQALRAKAELVAKAPTYSRMKDLVDHPQQPLDLLSPTYVEWMHPFASLRQHFW